MPPITNAVQQVTSHSPSDDLLVRLTDSLDRIADFMESSKGSHASALKESSINTTNIPDPVDKLLRESVIAQFLDDETVNDILVNGSSEIYICRGGDAPEKTNVTFPDSQSLKLLAHAIANSVGRPIDPRRPLVDARLKDGSRVNIITPPMARDGISMSIRKFPHQELTLQALVKKGELSEQVAEFLKLCAESRVSLMVSGGTATGKTTLLNAISYFIPANERIITVEDTAELRLQQPHVIRLETKQPETIGERQDEVNAGDLVRNALRMRPDRIIVGEVRGDEAFDMIQALNTGHDGSMTTVHANTPRDALVRLENLIAPRMPNTQAINIRQQISSALNFVVELVHNPDGTRKILSIIEVVGMEKDVITTQEIFGLKEGTNKAGEKVQSQVWTNIIPHHPALAQAMRANPFFNQSVEQSSKIKIS